MILGFICSLMGTQAGSTFAMLLGRFVLRDFLAERSKKFKIVLALDNAIEKEVTNSMDILMILSSIAN